METKSRRGLLYKWEDTAALDHKCGTCKTVLSSMKAKRTCFGKHEEVCYKYHKTLFFIGQSHRCEATELHDKRHREIAALLHALHQYDSTSSPLKLGFKISNKPEEKEAGQSCFDDLAGLALDDLEDLDAASVTDVTESSECTEGEDLGKKARKAAKKLVKAHARLKTFTTEDVERLDQALHPKKGNTLANRSRSRNNSVDMEKDAIIKANITFTAAVYKYRDRQRLNEQNYRLGIGKAGNSISMTNGETDQSKNQIGEILTRLGVSAVSPNQDRERKALLVKLYNAIKNDLEIVANEDRDTKKRMAGYWRYVNRKTYEFMMAQNAEWDWESGEKILPRRDEPVLASVDEGNIIEEEEEEEEEVCGLGIDSSSPAATTTLSSDLHSDANVTCQAKVSRTFKFIIPPGNKTESRLAAGRLNLTPTTSFASDLTSRLRDYSATLKSLPGQNLTPKTCPHGQEGDEGAMDSDYDIADLVRMTPTRPRRVW